MGLEISLDLELGPGVRLRISQIGRNFNENNCPFEKGETYMTIEEYAARQSAYVREEKEKQTIKGLVKLNWSQEQIIEFLVQNFKLDKQAAVKAYERAMATV